MSAYTQRRRLVKPSICECELLQEAFCACEIFGPHGKHGSMRINETVYQVEILSYLPPAPAEPVIDGFRLTKDNGESHDICLVHGRYECTCGDWHWRRERATQPELLDCKHVKACKQLLCNGRLHYEPRDQYPPQPAAKRQREPEQWYCPECRKWSSSPFCLECPI